MEGKGNLTKGIIQVFLAVSEKKLKITHTSPKTEI
jgi:hypothetical protein